VDLLSKKKHGRLKVGETQRWGKYRQAGRKKFRLSLGLLKGRRLARISNFFQELRGRIETAKKDEVEWNNFAVSARLKGN